MECPDCGERPERVPHRHDRSVETPRHDLTKPIVTLAVSALSLTAILGFGVSSMSPALLLRLMGVQFVVSCAVMAVSRLTWIGIGEPWTITLVRLAAVTAVTWVPLAPVLDLPLIFLLLYFIPLGVFAIANLSLLELDWQEAILFGLLTLVGVALLWTITTGAAHLAPTG